jgi:DNA polymerase V
MKQKDNLEFYSIEKNSDIQIEFVGSIKAGFPSPANDFLNDKIDLNKYVSLHPDATYYAKVNGLSMEGEFSDGDLLVIDKSLDPTDGKIAVCYIDGDFTVKRIKIEGNKCLLIPTNSDFPTIEVTESNQFQIWGVVSYVVKKV